VRAVVGDDASDQRLEGDAPAVLGGVAGAVPLDDPTQISRFGGAQDKSRCRLVIVER
jgi:hypothetical protein